MNRTCVAASEDQDGITVTVIGNGADYCYTWAWPQPGAPQVACPVDMLQLATGYRTSQKRGFGPIRQHCPWISG